jgi:ribonuclease P protein component
VGESSCTNGPDARCTHGPEARLRRKFDIARCQNKGTKIHCKHFLILFIPSEASTSRLAIAVTTKLEKRATVRNLIKRRVREVFRALRGSFVKPIDLVIVARRDVQSCHFDDYKRELYGAFKSKALIDLTVKAP